MHLLSNLESSMNQIWQRVKNLRFMRIFTLFCADADWAVLFLYFHDASVFFVHKVQVGLTHLDLGPLLFGSLLFIAKTGAARLFPVFFSRLSYLFMPNKKSPSLPRCSAELSGALSILSCNGAIFIFRLGGLTGWGDLRQLRSLSSFPHLGSSQLVHPPFGAEISYAH